VIANEQARALEALKGTTGEIVFAGHRSAIRVPLGSPRILMTVQHVATEAFVRGLGGVDVFESHGRIHVTVWMPWEGAEIGPAEFKAAGFRETCINHPAAMVGVKSEQSWSWDEPEPPKPPVPRCFRLQRDTDVTGVSGTGVVAEGVRFSDGTVAMRWLTAHRSTVLWASIEEAEKVHGHDGKTRVVWLDGGAQ